MIIHKNLQQILFSFILFCTTLHIFVSPQFLENELPLSLTSFLPSNTDKTDVYELGQSESITLVFNRPVIALGSDVEEHVDLEVDSVSQSDVPNNPFIFTIQNNAGTIRGRVRWVTTFIARFDTIDGWNTDLEFTVSLNPDMTTHDGISLGSISEEVWYRTEDLGGSIEDVHSPSALEATDNLWSGKTHNLDNNIWECPHDAKITVGFRGPVDANLIEDALDVTVRDPSHLDGVTFEIEPCDMSEQCIIIYPSGLHPDTPYELVLPAGNQYHPTAGLLSKDIVLRIHGLLPFIFDFHSNPTVNHVRYELWLRHGLSEEFTLDEVAASIIFVQSRDNTPVEFTLERPNKGTLRIVAEDVMPATAAQLSIIPDDQHPITDAYGQPLLPQNLLFGTQELSNFWETALSYEPLLFEKFPAVFKTMSRGEDDPSRRMYSQINEVTAENIQSVIASYKNTSPDLQYTGADNQVIQPSSWQDFDILELSVPNAHLNCPINAGELDTFPCVRSSFFTIEEQYETDCCKSTWFVTITDLAVTTLVDEADELLIWVTRMSTGDPVPGASVTIYTSDYISYQTDYLTEVEAQGVTNDQGIFIAPISLDDRYVDRHAYVQFGNDQAFVERFPNPPSFYNKLEGSLITDRLQYAPGDTMYVKGYVRDTNRGDLFIPELDRPAEVTAYWWETTDDECPTHSTVIVEYDAEFGTYETEIQIPDCASPGDDRMVTMSPVGTTVYYVISDPRRPTGFMTLSSSEQIYRPTDAIPLKVEVTTGTKVPIVGANVDVSWRIMYSQQPSSWDYIMPSVQEESEWTSFAMTTASDGSATRNFEAILNGSLAVSEGDTVEFLAEWIDPTGALVQESLEVPVRTSEWTLEIETSLNDPLPGLQFGVYLSAFDWGSTPLEGLSVQLILLQNVYDGDELVDQTEIDRCDGTTDSGSYLWCNFELSDDTVAEYTLRGTTADTRGALVESSVILGRTQEVWDSKPLFSYDPLNVRLDKQSYEFGETASLTFHNPFTNCWLLLKWGNLYEKQYDVIPLAEGTQRIQIPVEEGTCTGNCKVKAVFGVPRQYLKIPESIPISSLFDYNQPRTIEREFVITVPSKDRALQVDINLSEEKVLPGSSIDITVDFSPDSDSPRAPKAQIAVIAVDQAYLEIKPNPMADVKNDVEQTEQGIFSCEDNREYLASFEGYQKSLDKFLRRMSEDPFLRPNWDLTPSSYIKKDVDKTDEEFWDNNIYRMTQFPPTYSYTFEEWSEPPAMDGAPGRYDKADEVFFQGVESASSASAVSDGGGGGVADAAGPAGPAGSSSSAGQSGSFIEPRTTFEIVPLFVGNLETSSDSVTLTLDLPDNIGTFVIRTYVVDSDSRFGSAETEIVTTKPIALEPKQPRFARIGDRAEVGVSVIADDPNYARNIDVSFGLSEDSADLVFISSELDAHSFVSGTSPAYITWPVTFSGIGEASWTMLADDGADNTDGLLSTLAIKTVMDPIFVATSMAITANDEGTPWTEWIDFPETYSTQIHGTDIVFTDRDASLEIEAGVGRLVAIQNYATLIMDSYDPVELWEKPSDFWLGLVAAQAAFDTYPPTESAVISDATSLQGDAVVHLEDYTHTDYGLQNGVYQIYYDFVDLSLNLHGLYIHYRSPAGLIPEDLTVEWAEAVETELIHEAQHARINGHTFSNFNALASAFMVFGLNWVPDTKDELVKDDLSLVNLRINSDMLSIEARIDLALAYLLRGRGSDDELVLLILNDLFNSFRVQGETSYLGYESGDAYSLSIQSKALTAFLYSPSEYKDSLLIEKLANHISQSSNYGSLRSSSLAMIALSDYDEVRDTLKPDLVLTVFSGEHFLLDDVAFQSASQPPHRVETLWTELSEDFDQDPEPLQFIAEGEGEVSVSVGLRYMPPIYNSPVYRGILVERIIKRVDPVTRSGFGESLMLVESGETVEVTVQITTPDTLYDVRVEDRVPAGLEPLDPNLFDGVDTTQDFLYWYWYVWTPFDLPEIFTDKIVWESQALDPGTYTMTYQALAVTPGVFVWPPTHAYPAQQEEVMGLSSGGSFVVSHEYVPEEDVLDYLSNLDVDIPTGTVELKNCQEDCSIGGAWCDPYSGECVVQDALVKNEVINDVVVPDHEHVEQNVEQDPVEQDLADCTPFDDCETCTTFGGVADTYCVWCDSSQSCMPYVDASSDFPCDDAIHPGTGFPGGTSCTGLPGVYCDIRLTGRNALRSYSGINGIYTYSGQYLDWPSYTLTLQEGNQLFVYYDHANSSWVVGPELGGSDVFGRNPNTSESPELLPRDWRIMTKDGFLLDPKVVITCNY